MSGFAERLGYTKPNVDLAEDDMPTTLKAGLWDCMSLYCFPVVSETDLLGRVVGYDHNFQNVCRIIWFHFFRKSVDERPNDPRQAYAEIKQFFFNSRFYDSYGLLEFLAREPSIGSHQFTSLCNQVFERERAAFRFAEDTLVKITDATELEEVENAIVQEDAISVGKHIRRAAELYSQSPEPDYRNSIKESISAVEAAVSYVIGRKTYGIAKPLREVAKEFPLHPALISAFEKLYAFSSDSSGIRHALMDEDALYQEDAKYMLVSCSAFANYLIAAKARNS